MVTLDPDKFHFHFYREYSIFCLLVNFMLKLSISICTAQTLQTQQKEDE